MTQGVVTASDGRFYPAVNFLVESVLKQGSPITVFDIGLTEGQVTELVTLGAQVQQPSLVVPKTVPWWQTWNKPWYITASPYQDTLWIDSDCVVVGSLNPLFDFTRDQPLMVQHWLRPPYLPPMWLKDMYRKDPNRVPPIRSYLNAGVLGFTKSNNRDEQIFQTWKSTIQFVMERLPAPKWFPFFDETALVVTMYRLGLHVVLRNPVTDGWNRYMKAHKTPRYGRNKAEFEQFLRDVVRPEDVVLHFSGACSAKRYWEFWSS